MKINPHHPLGWLSLARLAGRMGYHDKALQCANRAVALDPKLVEAHLSKAAAARALGKTDIVQEVCHELATLQPENFRARVLNPAACFEAGHPLSFRP